MKGIIQNIRGASPVVLIPILSAISGSLAGKVHDSIKDKIQGKGLKSNETKRK